MKKIFTLAALSIFVLISCQEQQIKSTSKKTSSITMIESDSPYEAKIDSILARMSLKAKIGQLNQYSIGSEMTGPTTEKSGDQEKRYQQILDGEVGSVLNLLGVENIKKVQELVMEKSPNKIPMLFAYDVIHGYKTIGPIPMAEASSWDPKIMEMSTRIAGVEAAASGLNWALAPMVDITYDARWGRIMEGAGEDPYLGSIAAVARVKGFQTDDLSDPFSVASCVKHFAGYGFIEGGRDYNTSNIGKIAMNNYVLPPFKAAAEAGAASFMNSFNTVDGVPATANKWLQRELLKGKWNYDGVMLSDWASIGELIPHGVAADTLDAAYKGITAGSDIDMEANIYIEGLEKAINSGKVDMKFLDDAVRRVLRLKFRLGLFDDPYKYCDKAREDSVFNQAPHMDIVLEAARKSIVLLKNDHQLLPLLQSDKVAFIGPLVKDKDAAIGSWRAQAIANTAVSLYEGLEKITGKPVQNYEKGCDIIISGTPNEFTKELHIERKDKSGFAAAVRLARSVDKVVMVLGETAFMSGEGRSKTNIKLPGVQQDLLKAVYEVNKNIILVLKNGRPLDLSWEDEHIPSILEVWHLGHMEGQAVAETLYGINNPSGKLAVSFPRSVGHIPAHYNILPTGRAFATPVDPAEDPKGPHVFWSHYIDAPKSTLYPFGHGLSYTSFELTNFKISAESMAKGGSIDATVEVKNTGEVAGEEIVQLYITDIAAEISRPILELKGYKKISLKAGEQKTVTFKITEKELSYYHIDESFGADPGEFKVSVGNSSANLESFNFTLN